MDYSRLISKAAFELKPSGIRKFFDIAMEMENVVSLGVGEPDFVTPWHIRDAGIYSLEKGQTYYTSNNGLIELRREIAGYMRRRFELYFEPKNEIIVTVGGSEAIDIAIRALINPGDEVIIPEPSFVCYAPITSLAYGVPVLVKTTEENHFKLTAEALRNAITPKTKALILPYPTNPTGGIMEKDDLEAIAEVLRGTDITIISDEIYAELTYGTRHVSIASIQDMKERTVIVSGFSKAFAMTGWRMGFACAPAELMGAMAKVHQYALMCAPTMSQYAAIEALRSGDNDIEVMKEEYDRRRRFIVEGFNRIGLSCYEPKGAFYAFPCIRSTGLKSEEFCERLLYDQQVAVVPGNAFGESGEGFLRCSYAASIKNITTAIERIERFLEKLNG